MIPRRLLAHDATVLAHTAAALTLSVLLAGCTERVAPPTLSSTVPEQEGPARSGLTVDLSRLPATISEPNLRAIRAHAAAATPTRVRGFTMSASQAALVLPGGIPGVLTNGVVAIGVDPRGSLNVPNVAPSSMPDQGIVPDPITGLQPPVLTLGLRYVPTNQSSTEQGCSCEGWGVVDVSTHDYGGRNTQFDADDPSSANMGRLDSFVTSATSAVSTVTLFRNLSQNVAAQVPFLQVTHDYHRSPKTPNLYEVIVSIRNVTSSPIPVRYRRNMDWDIEPTPFQEVVTLARGVSPRIYRMTDNPFQRVDALDYNPKLFFANQAETVVPFNGFADHVGAFDHGANVDFDFGLIAPGATRVFKTFYGAAPDEATALVALGAAQVEAYSLAQASGPDYFRYYSPSEVKNHTTFMFAFKDIEGQALLPDYSPRITHTVSGGTLNAASGWYTGAPSVSFSVNAGSAGGTITSSSGCAATPAVTQNTAGQTFICTATNDRNLTTADTVVLRVDNTAPSVVASVSPTAPAGGWYTTTPVAVSFTTAAPGPSGVTLSGCTAQSLTQNTPAAGTTFTCTETVNGSGATASASATVKIDAFPPTVTPLISGTAGSNGWYTSSVTVTGTVSNVGPLGLKSVSCSPATIGNTAGTTSTCTAVGNNGKSATATTPTIRVDGSAPTARYSRSSAAFLLTDSVKVDCAVADVGPSGIDASRTTCLALRFPAATLGIGTYTYSGRATDIAGNVSPLATTTITIVSITTAKLCDYVTQFADTKGIANSLCKKIEHADDDLARGKTAEYIQHLRTFISEVVGLTGSHFTAAQGAQLVQWADALINAASRSANGGGTGDGGKYSCSIASSEEKAKSKNSASEGKRDEDRDAGKCRKDEGDGKDDRDGKDGKDK